MRGITLRCKIEFGSGNPQHNNTKLAPCYGNQILPCQLDSVTQLEFRGTFYGSVCILPDESLYVPVRGIYNAYQEISSSCQGYFRWPRKHPSAYLSWRNLLHFPKWVGKSLGMFQHNSMGSQKVRFCTLPFSRSPWLLLPSGDPGPDPVMSEYQYRENMRIYKGFHHHCGRRARTPECQYIKDTQGFIRSLMISWAVPEPRNDTISISREENARFHHRVFAIPGAHSEPRNVG